MILAWPPTAPLAVLVSGGLDSAVLLAEAVRAGVDVHPLYVRTGSHWEAAEQEHLRRFLDAVRTSNLKPLVFLDQPTADVYGEHWSNTGRAAPTASDPNDADFLPGRNILLFAKPLIWCALHGLRDLATAPLASNPFPDATPAFYNGLAAIVGQGLKAELRILRPYIELHKADVILRGKDLPLHLTFTCITPEENRPCGRCIKCGERQRGFQDANVPDPTDYARR